MIPRLEVYQLRYWTKSFIICWRGFGYR